MEGVVTAVRDHLVGSTLLTQSGTTLTVEDPDEFGQAGELEIGGETRAYTVNASEQVIIASALAGTYAEDEPVRVWPHQTERIALVLEAGSDEELEAVVPHTLHDKLATGTREDGEVVICEVVGDELQVVDVVAHDPPIDASYLAGLEMNAGVVFLTGLPSHPAFLSDPVPHGLSGEPTAITATARAYEGTKGTGRTNVTIEDVDEDSFRIRLRDTSGTNLAAASGTGLNVDWIAVRTEVITGQVESTGGTGYDRTGNADLSET